MSKKYLDYDLCRREDFEDKESYDNNLFDSYFCISESMSLGGSWTKDYVDYLQIHSTKCIEGDVNLRGEPCGDLET